ncbi:HEPN domain-containing protein [Burkholderia pseudomallei]|uniref:HEPN domain-containing protein n=1 Tax=Burkholderia pseudomallei TaxID=28450 RepID=UPI000A697D34|nr:HEPN domain-containing protein [Burkholderia pseudomallei]
MTMFTWPAYPASAAEFEELMRAIDKTLAQEGLKPFQRPMHVGRKLWEAFGWGGQVFPPEVLADQPGFTGDVLMAKANRWYDVTYADKLKSDWAYGFAPFRLGNSVWRVRAGVMYGQVRLFIDRNLGNEGVQLGARGVAASLNVLREVEGVTQGLVNQLSDRELSEYFDFYIYAHESLQWRESLPHTELLGMASHDYDQSTADVLAHRFGQARWAAEQAVEKTLKGLLTVAGTAFPTGGPNGHNLRHIAQILKDRHGIELAHALLDAATCSPKVRYGDEASSEGQALAANHAVLGVLEQLRRSPKTAALLATHKGA